MILNFKLVKVNVEYCNYLRKFDNKVPYNYGSKELRPFIGILFKVNDNEYFAPLTSPKIKHLKMKNTLDFLKIDDGKLGAVNFNNMIPVRSNNYEVIYFEKELLSLADKKYQELLKDQVNWLNKNKIKVRNKSYKLYNLYINDRLDKKIKDRCCDFKLLEEKCDIYNKVLVTN